MSTHVFKGSNTYNVCDQILFMIYSLCIIFELNLVIYHDEIGREL